MNPDSANEPELKDKDIEKIAETLSKEGKRQFGGSFKANIGIQTQETADSAPSSASEPSTPKTAEFISEDIDPAKKELYSIVKPLRTYERDIADAIRTKNE